MQDSGIGEENSKSDPASPLREVVSSSCGNCTAYPHQTSKKGLRSEGSGLNCLIGNGCSEIEKEEGKVL